MAKVCLFLCLILSCSSVNCRFTFFSQDSDTQSPLQLVTNIIPNIGVTLSGLLRPNQQRPVTNQYEQPAGGVQYQGQGDRGPSGGDTYLGFPTEFPQTTEYVTQSVRDEPHDEVDFEQDDRGAGSTAGATVTPPQSGAPDVSTSTSTAAPMVVFTLETESRNNFDPDTNIQVCRMINDEPGTCVNILACSPFLRVLQESQTNPAAVRMLRQAHCGFDGSRPKVCCPLPNMLPTSQNSTTKETKEIPLSPATTAGPATPSNGNVFVSLPEPPVCGVSHAELGRIVDGVPANLGAFPWMALLGYKRGDDVNWQCGGSLVSARHVLTAAHCIYNHENDLYLVRLGELDLAREDEGAAPQDVLIQSQLMHEQYSPKSFTSDVALLVLAQDVTFTNLVRPICLPVGAELRARSFEDYNPLIAGWGHTEYRGPSATHLQVLQLPVVSNEYCANAYRQYKAQKIDERVLCAGFEKGGKDACQGDSGGPLMQPIWNSATFKTYLYQIGVISFGIKCAEAGYPGVYTRVTHFVPWIVAHITGVPQA